MPGGLIDTIEAHLTRPSTRTRSDRLRHAYGFDDVAIVPGNVTVDPNETDVSWSVGSLRLGLPVVASAMDGVVDVAFAITLGTLGGLAVLNLEGVQTRYENPGEALRRIVESNPDDVTALMQRLYQEPVKDELIVERIRAIKAAGAPAAVSSTPMMAERFGRVAVDAGVDVFVVQSTVSTARFKTTSGPILDFTRFCASMPVPVVVGNCVSYTAATELMETGISALLVGVGPGAACTSREVLGIGVPQVTATMDCAEARDDYYERSGRYVPIITDGGMRTGGDLCKAIASGADAVMLGSPFAQCLEAPGKGHHWGMATPHGALPRGTRIKVGVHGTVEQTLFGPTSRTDGTENLIGAIRTCMGVVGASSLHEMHDAELVIAPAIKTEGKIWQLAGAR
jgi:IMP dehydrogenase